MLNGIRSPSLDFWKQALNRKLWQGAVLAIRVAACCIAIFGSWGAQVAKEWRRKAARISLFHFAHMAKPLASPLPLITPMRNLPKRDVVRSNADIAAAHALRKRFLALPGGELAESLKKATFHGAKADGICFGASLCFMKGVLKARCSSEEQLKALARKHRDGFSAKAAGIQLLYQKLEKLNWCPAAATSMRQGIEEAVPARRPMLQKLAAKTARYARLAEMIGLKLNTRRIGDFRRFDCDSSVRNQFNALPKGVYELGILTRAAAHSLAYLNLDFGAYLFDPNRGLMRCDVQNPAKDLSLLLKEYSGRACYTQEGVHQLEVYHYVLNTKS